MSGAIQVGKQQARFVRECFERGGMDADHVYGELEQEDRIEFTFFRRTSVLAAVGLLVTDDIGFTYRWIDG